MILTSQIQIIVGVPTTKLIKSETTRTVKSTKYHPDTGQPYEDHIEKYFFQLTNLFELTYNSYYSRLDTIRIYFDNYKLDCSGITDFRAGVVGKIVAKSYSSYNLISILTKNKFIVEQAFVLSTLRGLGFPITVEDLGIFAALEIT